MVVKNLLWVTLLSTLATGISVAQKQNSSGPSNSEEHCSSYYVKKNTSDKDHTASLVTICFDDIVTESGERKKQTNVKREPAENSYRDREITNSDHDLIAQESMAESTKWIMWIGLIGIPLTIIGLGALLWTIRQNANTLKHIQRASAIELRPFVDLNATGCQLIQNKDKGIPTGEFTFHCNLRVENTGKSQIINLSPIETADFTMVCTKDGHAPGPSDEVIWIEADSEKVAHKFFLKSSFLYDYIRPDDDKKSIAFQVPILVTKENRAALTKMSYNQVAFNFGASGLIRYTDKFQTELGRHYDTTFKIIGNSRSASVNIVGESELADDDKYNSYKTGEQASRIGGISVDGVGAFLRPKAKLI